MSAQPNFKTQEEEQMNRQAKLLELQEKQQVEQKQILLKLQEQQTKQEQLQNEIKNLSELNNKQIKELQDQHNFFSGAKNKMKYLKYKQKYLMLKNA